MKPEPRTSTAEPSARAEARREEILKAAATVFAEKGYHGASMRDMGKRLGATQASIYYYFRSKEAILEEICRTGIGEFLDLIREVADLDLPAPDRIRAGIRAHLTPLFARRFYVNAFLYSRHALPLEARKPLDADAQEYEAIWRRIFEDGQKEGTLRHDADPALTAFALLGMLNTLARRAHTLRTSETAFEDLVESFARLVCEGVATPGS